METRHDVPPVESFIHHFGIGESEARVLRRDATVLVRAGYEPLELIVLPADEKRRACVMPQKVVQS